MQTYNSYCTDSIGSASFLLAIIVKMAAATSSASMDSAAGAASTPPAGTPAVAANASSTALIAVSVATMTAALLSSGYVLNPEETMGRSLLAWPLGLLS